MIISTIVLPILPQALFSLAQLVFWLLNLLFSLLGLFCSLYLIIVHDDMSQNMIQPAELADYIKKYCPIEYAASFGYAYFTFEASGYWWVNILSMPLIMYNCIRYAAKDHKQYFITKGEYKKNFSRMELQYQVKSVYYAFLFAIALVLTIFKAIDFFGLL